MTPPPRIKTLMPCSTSLRWLAPRCARAGRQETGRFGRRARDVPGTQLVATKRFTTGQPDFPAPDGLVERRSRRPAPRFSSTRTGPTKWSTSWASRRPGTSIVPGGCQQRCKVTPRHSASAVVKTGRLGRQSAGCPGVRQGVAAVDVRDVRHGAPFLPEPIVRAAAVFFHQACCGKSPADRSKRMRSRPHTGSTTRSLPPECRRPKWATYGRNRTVRSEPKAAKSRHSLRQPRHPISDRNPSS